MIANKVACLVAEVQQAVSRVPASDPVAALKEAIHAQFEFHAKNQGFFEVILRHHKGPTPAGKESWESIRETIGRHEAILIGLIERAQKTKLLRKGSAADFAMALLGSIIHLTRTMSRESKTSHAEQAGFVFEFFMNGAKR